MDLFSTPMSVDENNSIGNTAPMDLFLTQDVNSVTSTPMDLFSSNQTPSVLDEFNTSTSSNNNPSLMSMSDHPMASPLSVAVGQKSGPVTPVHSNNLTPLQHHHQQSSFTEKVDSQTAFMSQLEAMIHFLKKNNLQATEEILRKETANFMNDDDLKIMREVNQKKVYYGLFKEPEFKMDMFDIDLDLDTGSNQGNDAAGDGLPGSSSSALNKKKKTKKETSKSKKARNDPNAPALTRIPLPELRDAEQFEKMRARKESMKAAKIGMFNKFF